MHFRKPICWIEDRSENLKAMNQSRQQNHRVKIGVKNDGTIMAMDAEILFDMGGYTRTHGGVPAIAASAMLRGPFRIKNYRANVFCVLTNKTPVGTYRSPGRYEANFVRERLVDMIAHRLQLDPADVRRRNLIRHEEMPYDLGKHPFHYMVYDTGDFISQMNRALEKIGYDKWKEKIAAAKTKAAPSASASAASSKPAASAPGNMPGSRSIMPARSCCIPDATPSARALQPR